MRELRYLKPASPAEAAAQAGTFYAGGTTLVDLMKLEVVTPEVLVDVNRLGLDRIEDIAGGVRLGAGLRNSVLAEEERLRRAFPALSEALLAGASAQLRNMASLAGNLLQRTRCSYFRDIHSECNKRNPGSGCAALLGVHDAHAVLGASPQCVAVFPSDMATALALAEPEIVTLRRRIPWSDFYLVPGDTPERETVLEPGELVTHLDLPLPEVLQRSVYVKVRDRSSYEFALASAAVALRLDGDRIVEARLALGGVATVPWRCRDAEALLQDQPATAPAFAAAAQAALAGARALEHNAYKIELARRTLVHALTRAAS